MGFEVGGDTALLVFEEGTSLSGATVRVSLDMSIDDFLALQGMANQLQNGEDDDIGDLTASVKEAYRQFGDAVLVDWDLMLRGEAIPANGEGMLKLPMRKSAEIFRAWNQAIGAVSPNSPGASTNGKPLEALSGQTEAA